MNGRGRGEMNYKGKWSAIVSRSIVASMALGDYLALETIIPNLRATERFGAIAELLQSLSATGLIEEPEIDAISSAVREKEQWSSSGIGSGIAISHAAVGRIQKPVIAFGRSHGGLDYEALDSAPVFFVVLAIVPVRAFESFLPSLGSFAKQLSIPAVQHRIAKAHDSGEILQALRS